MAKLLVAGKELPFTPGLIAFDKDGTLIDVHHYWCLMIKLRADKLATIFNFPANKSDDYIRVLTSAMGVAEDGCHLKPEGPVGIKPRSFIVQTTVNTLQDFAINTNEEVVENIFKTVDQESGENIRPLLKLLPGVKEFLASCNKHNITMAIATTDLTQRAEKALQALEIHNYFSLIIGGDKVSQTKPAPEMGQLILNELNLPPESAIMIGDHQVDIDMGESAGFGASIGVLTGLGGETNGNLKSKYISKDMTELELLDE